MKSLRFTFLFLVLLIPVIMVVDYRREHLHDDDSYLEQLEHTMECANWQTYEDPDYGFVMRYPSCFVPVSTEGDDAVAVRFAYVERMPMREVTYITLEASTQECHDSLSPYHEMQRMAEGMRGVCLRLSDTEYLMTARLKSRDPRVTAFRMNAKYVLRQRLWFVETLIFPEDFTPSVQRLVSEVNDWRPFRD